MPHRLPPRACQVRVGGLRFLPLLQFYDSTHLSRRAAYVALFNDRACAHLEY